MCVSMQVQQFFAWLTAREPEGWTEEYEEN